MLKRIISVAVTAALAIALIPAVYAADGLPVPDYYATGSDKITDHTDIGNTASEAANDFVMINGSEPKTRNVEGREFTYRTLDKDGAMLVNLKCDPQNINYLTVQLWGGDTGDTILWVCDPISGNMDENDTHAPQRNSLIDRRDWVELNYTSATPQYDGGFIYSTYEIPRIYTNGKKSVCLKIYSTGGPANYSENPVKEQTEPSRGIYGAFMTQNAAFDPAWYGISGGAGDNSVDDLYSITDSAAMAAQKDALKAAIIGGIETLRSWQIYNAPNAPAYMSGMITRTGAWQRKSATDTDWKDAYYTSGRMLTQNMTPLNILEVASYAYNRADELGLTVDEKAEMLGRVIAGVDFMCRAQGSNGGFFSNDDKWIGGPQRSAAGGNNLTGFGLRSVGKALLDVIESIDESVLNEQIDSDADGAADTTRKTAWISMMTSARDYLISLDGGYGHAPNQDMANSIAAMRFDAAIGRLGGKQLKRGSRASVFDICFGEKNNLVTSCKWVSPKGTILENFGAVQGGYSGDYGSNAIVEMAQLAELAKVYYGYDYSENMARAYSVIDYYYFTGKKRVNGIDLPQEYTEGLISNRNAYYPGTERYPVDVYSALTLENDTALKIITNYLTQRDINVLMQGGNDLNTSNVHYEDNILGVIDLYDNFSGIVDAMNSRNMEGYRFAMEDNSRASFAWADEMARNVVIKDNDDRIYMALNWRNPAYSTNIYNTAYEKDKQSIKANNLCRVHATNSRYDSYGYAAMTTDGYADWTNISSTDGYMQALMLCKYGSYTVIMNSHSDKSYKSKELDEMAELNRNLKYVDLITGEVYEYSSGVWHSDGVQMTLAASSTLVLKPVDAVYASEPAISDGAVSTTVTNNSDSGVSIILYAADYGDGGVLKNIKTKRVSVQPGKTEIKLDMPDADKAFVWDERMRPVIK